MKSVIVKSSFWESPIVQQLKMISNSETNFRKSADVLADVSFPFASVSFSVFYPDQLNENGIKAIQEIINRHQVLVVIVCLTQEESDMYTDFLCHVPARVSAVVCFDKENFNRKAAKFILDTSSKAKIAKRRIDRLVEEKRKMFMNSDIQGSRLLDSLIKDDKERRKLAHMMNTETGTIRETLVRGIPEVLEKDFFIESDE